MENAVLKITNLLIVFILFGFTVNNSYGKETPKELILQIEQQSDSFRLAVPVSKLVMSFPKNGFVSKKPSVGGSTQSPRYFNFEDSEHGLVISGWFESSGGYSSFEQLWVNEKRSWKSSGITLPENERRFAESKWEGVIYDIPINAELTSRHIRACWVAAGTWIDIHLSISVSKSDESSKEKLLEIFKSISISETK
jgi:hypothetical protein